MGFSGLLRLFPEIMPCLFSQVGIISIWSLSIIVSERKPGFSVQIKEGDPADGGINRSNTQSISRTNPAIGGIESDVDMGEKDSFRSVTIRV